MKILRIFLLVMIAIIVGIDVSLFFPLFGILYGFGFLMINLFINIIIFVCFYGLLYTYNFHNNVYFTRSLGILCVALFFLTNYFYRNKYDNELMTNGAITEGIVDHLEIVKSGYYVVVIFNHNNEEFESSYSINSSLDEFSTYRNALEGKKVKVKYSTQYPRINEVAENLEEYVTESE